MAQAAAVEPASWEGPYWLALARAAAGIDPRGAIDRALLLNPLSQLPRTAAARLRTSNPRGWEQAAAGLRREALDSGQLSIDYL